MCDWFGSLNEGGGKEGGEEVENVGSLKYLLVNDAKERKRACLF